MDSLFREVRRRSGFGGKDHLGDFAHQLGIPQDRLAHLEGRDALATPEELDRLATLVGVQIDQLTVEAVKRSPVTRLLLKTQREHGSAGLRDLEPSGAITALGEFVCVAGELARLDPWRHEKTAKLLGRLDRQAIVGRDRPPYGADNAAAELRRTLGLASTAGIPSMRSLLADLGVATFWADPGVLDSTVDGASTALPVAAVLVNLVGGAACWWRTRMTLAHELGHLLLDHQNGDGGIALISPNSRGGFGTARRRGRPPLFDGFDLVEARANAFAAHLLAPDAGVVATVADDDPTSEQAITKVCRAFGVGRTVAIYRLCHVFSLGPQARSNMESRGRGEPHDCLHADVVASEDVGLRAGLLRVAVLRALASGELDAVAARVALRLPLTEPLPQLDGVDPALLAPLQSQQALVLRRAQLYLDAVPQANAHFATAARRVPDGWLVETVNATTAAPGEPTVHVTFDLEHVRAVWPHE